MYNYVMQIGLLYYVDPNKVVINKEKYIKVTLKEREPFKNLEGKYDFNFITCYLPDVFEPFISVSENKMVSFKGRLRSVSEQTIFVVDSFQFLDSKYMEEN